MGAQPSCVPRSGEGGRVYRLQEKCFLESGNDVYIL